MVGHVGKMQTKTEAPSLEDQQLRVSSSVLFVIKRWNLISICPSIVITIRNVFNISRSG